MRFDVRNSAVHLGAASAASAARSEYFGGTLNPFRKSLAVAEMRQIRRQRD